MTISISEIEEVEFKLVDLAWRLPPGDRRDECNKALGQLREIKANMIARHPSILRKRSNDMDKRSQAARDQKLHDALREASAGHVCASYRAKIHGTVNAADVRMHELHHSLVNEGRAKCDAANPPPGGMPNADGEDEGQGTRFDEDKATAARAAGLAKRLGVPIPRPAIASRFYWEVNGVSAGLDQIERIAETVRINRWRRSQGLVPLE